jgi:hypothetical protein
VVKKSGRYLFLYESNKEFKIASYFSITLYTSGEIFGIRKNRLDQIDTYQLRVSQIGLGV